ncbi:translocation/assembly module TamB domain-containing protein [Hyphomonas sp.]|uniref:translocation/assembly module TamB domain-containing protein n=1 Tax=Hyphomonas sp. TaxID=87 RepID=UPI003919426A
METPAPPRSWLRRHPWLTGALVAVAGLAGLAAAVRVWITTDSGRDFIVSRINGTDIAGYGRIRIYALTGDPLSSMAIAKLSIEQEDGAWIEAQDLRLTWSPMGLLTRSVQVSEIRARRIDVLSRPVREDRPEPSSGGGSWQIQLTSLSVGELVLADDVAGPRSSSEISARFVQAHNGSLDAALRLRPIEGRGDRVDLLVVMTASRRFDVTVIADAPAGGFFSHLLELPEGSAGRLEASGGGDLRNGVAEARFLVDRQDMLSLSGKIEEGVLNTAARLNAAGLPLPANIAAFLGDEAEAALMADLNARNVPFEFVALVEEGEVRLSGTADTERRELVGPASVWLDLASLEPFWTDGAGLHLDGQLSHTRAGTDYAGLLRLIPAETSPLPFEAAAGQVSVSYRDGSLPFEGELDLFGPFALGEQVDAALGRTPRLVMRGRFETGTSEVILDTARLEHQTGSLTLNGRVAVAEQRLSLSGRARQSIAAFVPGFGGAAEGLVSLEGSFNALAASVALNLRGVSGPDALEPVIAGNGQLAGSVRIAGGEVTTSGLRLRLPGAEASVTGQLAGQSGLALDLTATQTANLETSGASVSLGEITAQLSRPGDALLITASSSDGALQYGSDVVSNVRVSARLEQRGDTITGPVRVGGRYEGERVEISAILDRREGATGISDIAGFFAGLRIAGEADIRDAGGLTLDARLTGEDLNYAGSSASSLSVEAAVRQIPGEAISVRLDADVRDTVLAGGTRIGRISGNVRTVNGGYTYAARIEDGSRDRLADVRLSGTARLDGDVPEGTLRLSGRVFGQAIETRRDAVWRLGDVPEFNADVGVLGGGLTARLGLVQREPEFTFGLDNVDAGPLLSLYRVPVSSARINGEGRFRPFGTNPSGRFDIRTSSPVTGLDGAISLDVNGTLDAAALRLGGSAGYGPTLGGTFTAVLPVTAREDILVALNREAPLQGNGQFAGDLAAIRLITLAYGHDIGGRLESRFTLNGSLDAPNIDGTASLRDGVYEYGAMGLNLNRITMDAALRNGALSVDANGAGAEGGSLTASGRMGGATEERIDLRLSRLLVYDRNRDRVRLSGNAALRDTADARLVTGALTIDEAAFSLDNLPGPSVRTLNVRWKEDITEEEAVPVLEKPIRFDLSVASDRRIFISGRGLDSEWGVQLAVTGSPAAPLLNGRATLVRGELELARRPFVFDSGQLTFDGPLDTARIAISAERQVNGFTARVDLSGPPAQPRIDLSSRPDLPPDEILSRMLFGRSVMDLSPLEAAELAGSIARLSGQRPILDPLGGLQAGLGLDRLRVGMDEDGQTEIGVGQYLAPDVYLEVTSAGAAGNSVEVEWQPRPQLSVTSEARSTGETRLSIRWKRDY